MKPILIIYTGGTIGMEKNAEGAYTATSGFQSLARQTIAPAILAQMPEHEYIEIQPAIDSALMTPEHWLDMARIITENYADYAGFIVLHGTDTMAYSASMLSFLLGKLDKSVIVTGAQIPLIEPCSDGANNLLVALQLAANYQVPEVCLYFASQLFRGNRASKISTSSMVAFASTNYLPLALFENKIKLFPSRFLAAEAPVFNLPDFEDGAVAVIYLTPGMPPGIMQAAISGKAKGLVLVSFGSGNIPINNQAFMDSLKQASNNDIVIINVSQCPGGQVSDTYAASAPLVKAGVVGGYDMTIEAAVTKLYYLLATETDKTVIKQKLAKNLRGELSLPDKH